MLSKGFLPEPMIISQSRSAWKNCYCALKPYCAEQKIKYFDIGQCDSNAKENTHDYGIYKFKKKWTGEVYNKYHLYYYFDEKDKIEEAKKGKGWMTKVWSKLPLPIIKIMGPKIASQLAL